LLFRSSDEVDYVRERIDPLLINGLRDKGMVALGISNGGFAYFMATAPLRSISDLKGRKVWAPEGDRLTQSIFAAAGISAVPLSVADVYTGLQTGLIDTIAGIPTGVIAFQWHTSISHLTHVPLMFLSGMLAVDAKVFSRISDADQAITRAVMARIFRDLDEANRKDNLAALEALRKQGITFVEPDDGQLVSWQAMADTALENIQKDGAFSADILEKMMAHLYNYRSQTVSNAQQP
jgi:TRAP-type C4-dicarboxylate transport system substrate-binding protein